MMQDLSDFILSYSHGRCHLFALVLAEKLNSNISVYWDIEADDGEGNLIYEDCLVHAFVKINDEELLDVNGRSYIDDCLAEYPCNKGIIIDYNIEQFKQIISDQKWFSFENDEYLKIKSYIEENFNSF